MEILISFQSWMYVNMSHRHIPKILFQYNFTIELLLIVFSKGEKDYVNL